MSTCESPASSRTSIVLVDEEEIRKFTTVTSNADKYRKSYFIIMCFSIIVVVLVAFIIAIPYLQEGPRHMPRPTERERERKRKSFRKSFKNQKKVKFSKKNQNLSITSLVLSLFSFSHGLGGHLLPVLAEKNKREIVCDEKKKCPSSWTCNLEFGETGLCEKCSDCFKTFKNSAAKNLCVKSCHEMAR